MLTYKYVPPEKMTTDYFGLAPLILEGGSLRRSFIDGGRDVRMVAAKGPNGKYAVRSGVVDFDEPKNHRPNPFTWWTGLTERFAAATDYTHTFEEAVTALREFEAKHKGSKPSSTKPSDAVHISKVPVFRTHPVPDQPFGGMAIGLAGNHNIL